MFKFVVLSCLLAVASAGLVPFIYSPYVSPINYRGPLSLAPGQPASVLGSDGRPLDTLEVNLDRSAHYAAKALDGTGLHLLKKRSAPILAPYSHILPYTPIVTHGAPIIAPAPLTYSAHYPYTAQLPLAHW